MVCVDISKQIPAGMKYIASKVHNPLRGNARNQRVTPK